MFESAQQQPAFTHFRLAGVKYLAIPHSYGVFILDDQGNNHGTWMSIKSFKSAKCEGLGTVCGKAALMPRT